MSCAEGTPYRQVKMYRYLLQRRMANFSSRPWSDGTWSTIYPVYCDSSPIQSLPVFESPCCSNSGHSRNSPAAAHGRSLRHEIITTRKRNAKKRCSSPPSLPRWSVTAAVSSRLATTRCAACATQERSTGSILALKYEASRQRVNRRTRLRKLEDAGCQFAAVGIYFSPAWRTRKDEAEARRFVSRCLHR